MPLASPRSVRSASSPDDAFRRQVSQSWGRHTAVVRAAFSGSCSASQRSLVTVNDATGTNPVASAQACGPPSSSTSSAASAGRAGVVPQQGRTHDGAGLVQADHPVLLPADGDRGDVVQAPGVGRGLAEGRPPVLGIDLGTVRMRGPPGPDELPGGGVPDHDLARLGGGVDAGNEGHAT